MHGHFFFLRKILAGANKIRFFLDQESGICAACLTAFVEEIKQGKCDAFYVRINKELTVDECKKALSDVKKRCTEHKALNPGLTDSALKPMLIKKKMAQICEFGKWHDR